MRPDSGAAPGARGAPEVLGSTARESVSNVLRSVSLPVLVLATDSESGNGPEVSESEEQKEDAL